jgi:hypothetical protein
VFEIKLNSIIVTKNTISLTARLYDTQGPFITQDNPPRYDDNITYTYTRTLLIERSYTLNRPINRAAILTYLRNRMEDYNDTHGSVYQPSDFYINITAEATGFGE